MPGFRSWRGAEIFCIIPGYISTLRQQHQNTLAALNGILPAIRSGLA